MKHVMLLLIVVGFSFVMGCSNSSPVQEETSANPSITSEEQEKNKVSSNETDSSEEKENNDAISIETDTVKEDLLSYYNEGVLPLAKLEAEALGTYGSVTGDNYKDDETLYYALVDVVIPTYRKFTDELQGLRPSTPEVRDLHRLYVDGAHLQLSGMLKMVTALEEQSYDKMAEANELIYEGYQSIMDFQYELQDLMNEHDIDMSLNDL